ncbi:MAG: ribonuclease HI family protein [Patescibacteria group bacterium]|jgi:ribonuclease HI
MKYALFTDGGARGNPGPAAAGVVLKDAKGNIVTELGMYLGTCTNNEAEYRALVYGLETAKRHGVSDISCFLDSELVVRQLNGQYKVKDANLRGFYTKVKELGLGFSSISYTHIFRSKNREADTVVNQVLDAENNE